MNSLWTKMKDVFNVVLKIFGWKLLCKTSLLDLSPLFVYLARKMSLALIYILATMLKRCFSLCQLAIKQKLKCLWLYWQSHLIKFLCSNCFTVKTIPVINDLFLNNYFEFICHFYSPTKYSIHAKWISMWHMENEPCLWRNQTDNSQELTELNRIDVNTKRLIF